MEHKIGCAVNCKSLLKVIYVGGSDNQSRDITDFMEADGFVVNAHLSYETAFSQLTHTDLDLLVLDSVLPGKTGLDVVEEIRQVQPDLPIVLLTVSPDHEGIMPVSTVLSGFSWLKVMDNEVRPNFFLQECRSLVLEATRFQKDKEKLQFEYDRFRTLHQAAGLLAGFSYGGTETLSPDDAVELIRKESRRRGLTMHELARRISECPSQFAAMFRS